MRFLSNLVLMAFFVLAGCQQRIAYDAAGLTVNECADKKISFFYCKDYNDPTVQVTWYGDMKPFLNSNVDGYRYKCTHCHTDYNDYDFVTRDGGMVQKMLTAVRNNNPRQIMPRSGDYVKDRFLLMMQIFASNPVKGDEGEYPF